MISTSQKLAAEFLGTALLSATVVGTGITGAELSASPPLTLLASSITTAAMLFVLISMLSPISGAHINPVITIAFALKRVLSPKLAALYIITQFVGAIFGVVITHLMFEIDLVQIATTARNGYGIFLSEFLTTFLLLFIIFTTRKSNPDKLPLLVALLTIAGYWFSSSGAFANPAVTIARGFTDSFAGIALHSIAGFVVAQLIAIPFALIYYHWQHKE